MSGGVENVKRTLALNYFTFVLNPLHKQFYSLAGRMNLSDWGKVFSRLGDSPRPPGVGRVRHLQSVIYTRMLWLFGQHADHHGLLSSIDEPAFGNPYPAYLDGRLISQDLANSVLEFYAMDEQLNLPQEAPLTVCEVGAGYGRNAYVFLKRFPRCRYIVIDIPPALYVSQSYLKEVAPGKRVMSFSSTPDRDAMESADIIFLLPHQAAMLEAKSVDLFINISSLHEMTMPQIDAYFDLVDRVTRGHFYFKQWSRFHNRKDGIVLDEHSYPVKSSWQRKFHRKVAAQPGFFEALYHLS
jgi:putative sugar O-methyltransferase